MCVLGSSGPRVASLSLCSRGGLWRMKYCWNSFSLIIAYKTSSLFFLRVAFQQKITHLKNVQPIRPLKTHMFKHVLLSTTKPHGRRLTKLFRKLKLSCTCSKSTSLFTPHLSGKGQSETTLSPDLPSTRIICSTSPSRKFSKSCSPLSDLTTRYGQQATTRFTCLVVVPFEHELPKSGCR